MYFRDKINIRIYYYICNRNTIINMKKSIIYFLLFAVGLLSACSSDESEPKEIYPIELSGRILCVDHTQTMDTVDIFSGNGGYRIIEIILSRSLNEEMNKKLDSVPLKDIFNIYVEGEKIIVERVLLEDLFICGSFVLVDAEGIRKTCLIQNPGTQGFPEVWPD